MNEPDEINAASSCILGASLVIQIVRFNIDHPLKYVAKSNELLYITTKTIGGAKMTTAVRVSGELVKEAKIYSKIDKRSITGQIEHWARIGKCAEENPDLTYSLIKEILIGVAELEQGESSEYKFG